MYWFSVNWRVSPSPVNSLGFTALWLNTEKGGDPTGWTVIVPPRFRVQPCSGARVAPLRCPILRSGYLQYYSRSLPLCNGRRTHRLALGDTRLTGCRQPFLPAGMNGRGASFKVITRRHIADRTMKPLVVIMLNEAGDYPAGILQ